MVSNIHWNHNFVVWYYPRKLVYHKWWWIHII